VSRHRFLFAHDLFGKPLHTFPDHALERMTYLRIVIPLYLLFEHDLFGKPLHTFPDHALGRIKVGLSDIVRELFSCSCGGFDLSAESSTASEPHGMNAIEINDGSFVHA